MTEKTEKTEKKPKRYAKRYSVSVSGGTYDRLRTAVDGSLAAFVDDIVLAALDNSTIRSRVIAKCYRKDAQ